MVEKKGAQTPTFSLCNRARIREISLRLDLNV